MFSKSIYIHTYFENINGLVPGNNVRLNGIDIGTVERIELQASKRIYVEMAIEEKIKKFIPLNSIATLGTDGLMGNRLVNIEPGIGEAKTIEDGIGIQSKAQLSTDEMMLTLDQTNKNISVVSEDLVHITSNINKSKGTLYSVLLDTNLAGRVNRSLENISAITESLRMFSADLAELSDNTLEGQGLLGQLTKDSSGTQSQFNEALQNILITSKGLSEFSITLTNTMDSIKNSKGTLSTLLYDTTMAHSLQSSMANIDTSTIRLNELMIALRSNFLFRKYFRKKKDKLN